MTAVRETGDQYEVETVSGKYLCVSIIVATGFYDIPNRLNIPGEDLPKVTHYYKEPHFYAMQRVLVVGANNSAVDAALETWRKGAEVSMVIQSGEIGRRVKYWVKPDIENRIKEGTISAYFNSKLVAIREKEVDIEGPEGKITIPNDFVLAMTGYQPNFEFLKNMGIALSDNDRLHPSLQEETMESNRKNIYLAGVVVGGMDTHLWFIENSREHAVRIIRSILSKKQPANT